MTDTVVEFNKILIDMVDNFNNYIPRQYLMYLKFNPSSNEFIVRFLNEIDSECVANKDENAFKNIEIPLEYSELTNRNKSILWKYITILHYLAKRYKCQ